MPKVTPHSEADASAPSDPHSASAPARDATPASAPTREDPVAVSGAVAPSDAHASMVEVFLRLPEAVVLVDGSGTIVWGNPSAERIFERTLEDWAGQSALDLIHPDDREFALRALSSILDKDVGTPIEMRVNAASGWRLVELVGTTTQWLGDPVILCSMRDLTERRRYELASGREARFRSLVHNAGSVMMLVSESGRIESVSSVITRLLGHDHELLERRHLCEIVAPEDRPALQSALDTARRGATAGHPVTARIRLLRHGSAGTVPFEMHMVNLLDDPTVEGIVLTAHDATAQVSAEHDLVDALSRLTATLDSTADGILVVDTAGKITDFNGRFVEIWGIPDDAVVRQQDVSSLEFALDQLTDPQVFLTRLRELRLQPETDTFDLLTFKDGRVIERFSKPQCIAGVSVGRVYSFRDITDRKRLEDELSFWAFHDSLTGLANNALFQDRLQHALSRLSRAGSHLAILYLDLDDFKTVNDSLGHGEGDRLLRKVASTLCDLLRPSDTAARLGGDEFAILIEDLSSPEVTNLAQRILESLRRPVRLRSKIVSAACSIGVAFDEEGITSEQLLRNADIAMYQAKRRGKNRAEVYRADMHGSVVARIELEQELKSAVAAGDLVAHYQPVIDLQTLRLVGFEALARWPRREGEVVDPRQFVPLAQEIGLIGEIDSWVLRSACRQVRAWREEGLCREELDVSVNLSASQLADETLADRIADDLFHCQFDPRSLILEITENEVITDDAATLHNLAALRLLGVRIALDDFGTGYSNLVHLDRLPVDLVKIGRAFVETLGSGDDTRSMAAALIQLARTLGYGTIGEGVETGAQLESLRRLGCARAQGYYLGRPLDAEAARRLLGAARDRRHSAGVSR